MNRPFIAAFSKHYRYFTLLILGSVCCRQKRKDDWKDSAPVLCHGVEDLKLRGRTRYKPDRNVP